MSVYLMMLISIFTWASTAYSSAAKANVFASDLQVYNLFASSPFQANVTSTYNSTVIFTVVDQDYPELEPVTCEITWQAGLSPPDSSSHQCSNETMRVWMPEGTYYGVGNFRIDFAHSVIDTSVGECPLYCQLTKFASLNLTHTETPNYNCDLKNATCETTLYTTLTAAVYAAIA